MSVTSRTEVIFDPYNNKTPMANSDKRTVVPNVPVTPLSSTNPFLETTQARPNVSQPTPVDPRDLKLSMLRRDIDRIRAAAKIQEARQAESEYFSMLAINARYLAESCEIMLSKMDLVSAKAQEAIARSADFLENPTKSKYDAMHNSVSCVNSENDKRNEYFWLFGGLAIVVGFSALAMICAGIVTSTFWLLPVSFIVGLVICPLLATAAILKKVPADVDTLSGKLNDFRKSSDSLLFDIHRQKCEALDKARQAAELQEKKRQEALQQEAKLKTSSPVSGNKVDCLDKETMAAFRRFLSTFNEVNNSKKVPTVSVKSDQANVASPAVDTAANSAPLIDLSM